MGRKVVDVLDAWIDQNLDTWALSSARDQQSRVRSIKQDKIAEIPIARMSIADVERWHTRLRRGRLQDAGIRNQHGALSAALNQAVRWGWASQNVASLAQRKTTKKPPRGVMSLDDVRAVIAAAGEFDPAAALALRLPAMTGARRAELAALRWTDVDDDGMLTIDSAIEVIRHPGEQRAARRADQDRQRPPAHARPPHPETRSGRCAENVSHTVHGCSVSAPISCRPITSVGGGLGHERRRAST